MNDIEMLTEVEKRISSLKRIVCEEHLTPEQLDDIRYFLNHLKVDLDILFFETLHIE